MPESLIKKLSETEQSDHSGAPLEARLKRDKRLIPREINVPGEPRDINPLMSSSAPGLFHRAWISRALRMRQRWNALLQTTRSKNTQQVFGKLPGQEVQRKGIVAQLTQLCVLPGEAWELLDI